MNVFADMTILVPIDFSDEADRALDYALDLAGSTERVRAVHVAPPLIVYEPGVCEIISDDERRKRLLVALNKRYASSQYRGIKFEVRFGDAGHEIVAFANELKAGLIVIPSHGRTGLRRLLIGSVAERVTRLATCPVLVLRKPQAT
jgi:nucleotide-binding universal stress UspA family protein